MARPAWKPTDKDRRQVQAMSAYGIPEKDIAAVVGVDAKTLRKHCRSELDNGATLANSQVAEFLFDAIKGRAVKSDQARVTAAIFWAKTRMGWKESVINEHANAEGKPFIFQVSSTDAKL